MGYIDSEGETKPIDSPEAFAQAARSSASQLSETLSGEIEAREDTIKEITERCDGPLTMRAKRAGEIVTVAVCMSPEAPDEKGIDSVFVTRDRTQMK